jgi:hypothetical protein
MGVWPHGASCILGGYLCSLHFIHFAYVIEDPSQTRDKNNPRRMAADIR